ncbi:hypothetical protein [Enterococcus avium]|nr:hypothetical protein [Enterococcus avium]
MLVEIDSLIESLILALSLLLMLVLIEFESLIDVLVLVLSLILTELLPL